jgi:hypothetical protein
MYSAMAGVLLLADGSAHGASWVSANVAMVVSLANQLGYAEAQSFSKASIMAVHVPLG